VTGSDHRPVLGKFTVSILKQEIKPFENNTGQQGK